MESVKIPKSVNTIESFAFYHTKNLTNLTLEHTNTDTLTIKSYTAFKIIIDTKKDLIIKCPLDNNNIPLNESIYNYDWVVAYRNPIYVSNSD